MKKFLIIISYLLVFAIACVGTAAVLAPLEYTKLEQLQNLIEAYFIADVDSGAMEDAAAAAMVDSLGDRWSYYLSAEDYKVYLDQMSNSYVGVGITITVMDDGYLEITQVAAGGPAEEAGIQIGDILIRADGQDCAELGLNGTSGIVRGKAGTTVELTLRRGSEELVLPVERRYFETPVARYELLEDNIGLVTIVNFDSRCADETIAAIEELRAQGAESIIFDVRNNPGGYKDELVRVLDYLLPEGVLFRSEYYDGTTEEDRSDADCVDFPMAVLINSESYSAAEFFAAALSEYDAAVTVGQKTVGKGYFQHTYELLDGSAVGLSVGKYYTPNGISLAGEGVTPDVVVEVDDETFAQIYSGVLFWEEDPQILAAIDVLKSGNGT